MTKNENFALEYAVSVLNELIEFKKIDHKPFRIIWNTSLGYAELQILRFDEYSNPIIDMSVSYGNIQATKFNPSADKSALFSVIRTKVANFFNDNFGYGPIDLLQYPDLLLQELINIIKKIENIDELKSPEYSTVWNFNLLNSSFSMPFLNDDSLEVKAPLA